MTMTKIHLELEQLLHLEHEPAHPIHDLSSFVQGVQVLMPLINGLPNITFFIKDLQARYVLANVNLAVRSGLNCVDDLLGKTAAEVFSSEIGMAFTQQDQLVMSGQPLSQHLELHLYQSGLLGWCMATKIPLKNRQGEVLGMAGMAVDLQEDRLNRPNINSKLSKVEQYISEKFDTPIQITELANIAGLSVSQLNRQFQNIFHLTPSQLIQKKRLDCAIELLAQDISVTEVSVRCGYADHSAFGRKFKELTSVSPRQFKQQLLKFKQG